MIMFLKSLPYEEVCGLMDQQQTKKDVQLIELDRQYIILKPEHQLPQIKALAHL